MDSFRFEPGSLRQPPQDEEDAGARQAAALGVQEQLRPVAPVEVWTTAREVATDSVGRGAAERYDPFLGALAGGADDSLLEVDVGFGEPDRLADAKPGTVEELDERTIAECARRRSHGGIDQPLGFRGRERARKSAAFARQRDGGGRVVAPSAEEHEVAIERARRGCPPGDRRR